VDSSRSAFWPPRFGIEQTTTARNPPPDLSKSIRQLAQRASLAVVEIEAHG
jgi:hypothetical protein